MPYKFNPFTGTLDVVGPAGSGSTGPTGPAGPGVAAGGTTGQVLAKNSNTDYDTEWIDPPAGSNGLQLQDGPIDDGTYVYVGLEHADGSWAIYRRTLVTNAREYATGGSGYATAWTGRAGLSYA